MVVSYLDDEFASMVETAREKLIGAALDQLSRLQVTRRTRHDVHLHSKSSRAQSASKQSTIAATS